MEKGTSTITASLRQSQRLENRQEEVRKMDVAITILHCIAIFICIYLLWQVDKKITKIVRGEKDDHYKHI